MRENADLPKVTVAVPVRNCRNTVEKLLESLLRLDYPSEKLEIITVDGSSTDGTREIIAKYPVKLITEPGLGLNHARNLGLKNASGTIIAFTDGDCTVPRDWIYKIVRNFNDKTVGAVGGTVVPHNPENLYAHYGQDSLIPVMPVVQKKVVLDRVWFPYPVGCNMAFRREALEKIGGFDPEFKIGYDEIDTLDRLVRQGFKISCDPEVTVEHFHRSTLKSLLRQWFRYGIGQALFRKKTSNRFLRRILAWALVAFIAYFPTILGLALLSAFFKSPLLGYAAFFLLVTPLAIATSLYVWKLPTKKVMPFSFIFATIDFLRVLALFSGDAYATATSKIHLAEE